MLREILEEIVDEILCPEAKALTSKIGKGSGVFTLKRSDGQEFEVDAGTACIGGYMPAKNSKGKSVELDICGNHSYKIA